MKSFLKNRIILVSALTCFIATGSSAQTRGDGPDSGNNLGGSRDDLGVPDFTIRPGSPEAMPPKTSLVLTKGITKKIIIELGNAATFCGRIKKPEYVIDCLSYEYTRIAAALPNRGDYAPVKKAIAQAAGRLEGVVRKNRSKVLPAGPIAQGGPKPRRTARAIRAVATTSLPAVKAETIQIIRETQTVLLRSTENSQERRRQFQRIVAAMDTSTILLRSI